VTYCSRYLLFAVQHCDAPCLVIENVRLPLDEGSSRQYTVICRDEKVYSITLFPVASFPESWTRIDGQGGLILPSLCHSHIHLDKCNILTQCEPLVTGSFDEAMTVTAIAKSGFTVDDLLLRGRELIRMSVLYGTTAMRAHVEVDDVVEFRCIQAGLSLQTEFKDLCDVHLCVFAQEPLFRDSSPSRNLDLLRTAVQSKGISAIGSAPYVESSNELSLHNIRVVFELAVEHDLHVDFHLDYNLSNSTRPMIHDVIQEMRTCDWTRKMPNKRVTIGHATRLSLFSDDDTLELKKEIGDLPISVVGLPQSDLYMMGRDHPARPRGTLDVPYLTSKFGFDIAMSVNNVGNAFTPQGNVDPLGLCPLGVAIYQSGTPETCRILLEAVTQASKVAVGASSVPRSLRVDIGYPADFVILPENHTIQEAALSPSSSRITIKGGRVVATRRSDVWIADRAQATEL